MHYVCMRTAIRFSRYTSPTNFGFLACGVYRVPLLGFPRTASLWHFQVRRHILRLRPYTAVICSHIPNVIVSVSTNTTGIAARASMDFPLVNASNRLGRQLLDFGRVLAKLVQRFFQLADPVMEFEVILVDVQGIVGG